MNPQFLRQFRRKSLKTTALISLVGIFSFTQVTFAYKPLLPARISPPAQLMSPLPQALQQYGSIQNKKAILQENAQRVFLIQDIHGRESAQHHISKIIRTILNKYPAAKIGIEGAAGPISAHLFRGPEPDINKEVGSFFLNIGHISGPEHVVFANSFSPQIIGIEDADIYRENVRAIQQSLKNQLSRIKEIEKEKEHIQKLKDRHYSPILTQLDQIESSNLTQKVSALISFDNSQRVHAFNHVDRFKQATDLEKSIDFKLALKQRNQFITALIHQLNRKQLNNFYQRSHQLKSGHITYPQYYSDLKIWAQKANMSLTKTPEFARYIDYIEISDELNSGEIIRELNEYEKAIWNQHLKTADQIKISQQWDHLKLRKKLFQLKLTWRDWETYKSIATGHGPFEKFYQLAEKRNDVLAQNFLKLTHANTSILVAGGFHAKGIRSILESQNREIIVITPKLLSSDQNKNYQWVFTQEKTPLDELFDSPQISLSAPSSLRPLNKMGFNRLKTILTLGPQLRVLFSRLKDSGKKLYQRFDQYKITVATHDLPPQENEIIRSRAEDFYVFIYRIKKSWWTTLLTILASMVVPIPLAATVNNSSLSRPPEISEEDWELLLLPRTPWGRLQNSTLQFLVRYIYGEAKKADTGIKSYTQLQNNDFTKTHIPFLGKKLGGLYNYYTRKSPKDKPIIQFLLEDIGLIERQKSFGEISTIRELKKLIDQGNQERKLGFLTPWDKIDIKLIKRLVEELAATKQGLSRSEFLKLNKQAQIDIVLKITGFDFRDIYLEKLGRNLEGLLRHYSARVKKQNLPKTGRWLLLESIGYLPRNLLNLSELKTSQDFKHLMDEKAILEVDWHKMTQFNLALLRTLVQELATHTGKEIKDLLIRDYRDITLPGLDQNLSGFLQHMTRQNSSGAPILPYIRQQLGFTPIQRLMRNAFSARAAIDLFNNNALNWNRWEDLPLSAQRGLLFHLSAFQNKTVNQLVAHDYNSVVIPTIGQKLSGLYARHDSRNGDEMTTPQRILHQTGFIFSTKQLVQSLKTIQKGFNAFERGDIPEGSVSFYHYLITHNLNLNTVSVAQLREELDIALLQIASIKNQTPQIKHWKKALEAYWAILDTAEWMPEQFSKLIPKAIRKDKKLKENDTLIAMKSLINDVRWVRKHGTDEGIQDTFFNLWGEIYEDSDKLHTLWEKAERLGRTLPFTVQNILTSPPDNPIGEDIGSFVNSVDGKAYMKSLELWKAGIKVATILFLLAISWNTLNSNIFSISISAIAVVISAKDLANLKSVRTKWSELSKKTRQALVKILFDEVKKKDPSIESIEQLKLEHFTLIKIPLIGKTLSGFRTIYNKDKPKNKPLQVFILEELGFVEKQKPIHEMDTIHELVTYIQSRIQGKNSQVKIQWRDLKKELFRKIIEELAAAKLNISRTAFLKKPKEKQIQHLLQLSSPDFKITIKKLGRNLEGLYFAFNDWSKKGQFKTPRWLILEKAGILPSELPTLAEIKNSRELKRLRDEKAILEISWERIINFNLPLARNMVRELAATVFYGAITPNEVDEKLPEVSIDDVNNLSWTHYNTVEIPGFGGTLNPLLQHFDRKHRGARLMAHLVNRELGFVPQDIRIESAYTLSTLTNIFDTHTFRKTPWRFTPLSAQRAILIKLIRLLNTNGVIHTHTFNSINERDYQHKIQNGRTLWGFYNYHHFKNDSGKPTTKFIPESVGFITKADQVVEAYKHFQGGIHLIEPDSAFSDFFKTITPQLNFAQADRLRNEMERVLINIDQKLALGDNDELQNLKTALEAYWALLDTAQWMPDKFTNLMNSAKKKEPRIKSDSAMAGLLAFAREIEWVRQNSSVENIQETIFQLSRTYLDDEERTHMLWDKVERLAKIIPDTVKKSISSLPNGFHGESIRDFLDSRDGKVFQKTLDKWIFVLKSSIVLLLIVLTITSPSPQMVLATSLGAMTIIMKPKEISQEDWDLIRHNRTDWNKVSKTTIKFLVQYLFQLAKKDNPSLSKISDLQQRHFMNTPIDLIQKKLGGLYRVFQKKKPKGKDTIQYMFEELDLVEYQKPLHEMTTTEELRVRIESGAFSIKNQIKIPWRDLNTHLLKLLIEELAAMANELSLADFQNLSEEERLALVFNLHIKIFDKEIILPSIGTHIRGVFEWATHQVNTQQIPKTPRWHLLETTGFIPHGLPNLAELKKSEDLKRLIDAKAIYHRIPWQKIININPAFGRRLLKELAAVHSFGAQTSEEVEKRIEDVTLKHIGVLTVNEFNGLTLPGSGKTLSGLYSAINYSKPKGKSTKAHMVDLVGFVDGPVYTTEAYGLNAVYNLRQINILSSHLWRDLPLSAQRAIVNQLRIVVNSTREEGEELKIRELRLNPDFQRVTIPSLGTTLDGMTRIYHADRANGHGVRDILLKEIGFVDHFDTVNERLIAFDKALDIVERMDLPFDEVRFYHFILNSENNFNVGTYNRLKIELENALLRANRNFRKSQNKNVKKWMDGLEAYWSLMDSAALTPEHFIEITSHLPNRTKNEVHMDRIRSLRSLSEDMIWVEENLTRDNVHELVYQIWDSHMDGFSHHTSKIWNQLERLATAYPDLVHMIINSPPDDHRKEDIESFLQSKDGIAFLETLPSRAELPQTSTISFPAGLTFSILIVAGAIAAAIAMLAHPHGAVFAMAGSIGSIPILQKLMATRRYVPWNSLSIDVIKFLVEELAATVLGLSHKEFKELPVSNQRETVLNLSKSDFKNVYVEAWKNALESYFALLDSATWIPEPFLKSARDIFPKSTIHHKNILRPLMSTAEISLFSNQPAHAAPPTPHHLEIPFQENVIEKGFDFHKIRHVLKQA